MESLMSGTYEVAIVNHDADQRAEIAGLMRSISLTPALFESAEAFLDGHPESAGCVLTDMRMPGISGLQLQRELTCRGVHVPLIVLTAYADVPAAVQTMKAGAFDFLERPCSPQLLLETVQCALRRCEELRRRDEETQAVRRRFASLTPRERQVMHLVVDGVSNKNVASKLKLSEKTVEFHRGNVMIKMAAGSLAELVRLALFCPQLGADERPHTGITFRRLGKTPV